MVGKLKRGQKLMQNTIFFFKKRCPNGPTQNIEMNSFLMAKK